MIQTKKRAIDDGDIENKKKRVKKTVEKSFSKKDKLNPNQHKQQTKLSDNKSNTKKAALFKGNTEKNNKKNPENVKPEDWSLYKKQKKDLRIVRKKKKNEDMFELCAQAKKIGEVLRRKNLKGGDAERNDLCEKLHSLLKGTNNKSMYSQMVLTHDMTRVVQVMLKYSSSQIKEEILQDLLSCIVPMLQSSYGRFCVKKMFKYGSTKTRCSIIDSFFGNVVKLTAHNFSSSIVDFAYVTWATPIQKIKLKQEFYGDIYRNNKDDGITCLADTYKNSIHMKGAMLSTTKANLLKIINKQLLDNALFHAVLYEFLEQCSEEDRTEFISLLCPTVATICSTKEGTRCGMICLWHATNKEKKVILRCIKEHILKLAQHEFGHVFLLAILSGVDDTVLLNKMLVNELVFNANTLVQNEWGRRILLWLVAPEDKTYFHPGLIEEIDKGVKSSSCKKSSEIRAQEIIVNCRDPLCDAIAQNSMDWLKTGSIALVTVAILKVGFGESLRIAFNSLAQTIVSTNWKVNNESLTKAKVEQNKTKDTEEEVILGIEHAGLHIALKKLAQYDKIRADKSSPGFGESIVNCLKKKVLKQWLTLNRACFFLLTIVENSNDTTKQMLIELLRPLKEVLEEQKHTGAKLLLKHI